LCPASLLHPNRLDLAPGFVGNTLVNVNFAEIAVICVVALILFGPEQLPQIARQLGKLAGDLRKVSNSVRREWYNAVYPPATEIRRDLDAGGQALRSLKAQVLAPPPGTQSVPREATHEANTSPPPPEVPST
jgi:Sec-independent protein translocase protein TatA